MKASYKTKRLSSKGQAVVEFALVLPFFLLIIVGGIIDFGVGINNYITLQNLISSSAEWGAKYGKNQKEIEQFINNNKPQSLNNIEFKSEIIKLQTGGSVLKISAYCIIPAITPFYKIITNNLTNTHGIKISTASAFKIPEKEL